MAAARDSAMFALSVPSSEVKGVAIFGGLVDKGRREGRVVGSEAETF
jgi:hypothetical protein